MPSCFLILSLLPQTALIILGTRWNASPPQSVNVSTPYKMNKGFPFENAKNKVIYINNKDIFDYEELIKIIDLINLGCEIIFIWYRNWWINKNEEVQKIHKLLNE